MMDLLGNHEKTLSSSNMLDVKIHLKWILMRNEKKVILFCFVHSFENMCLYTLNPDEI